MAKQTPPPPEVSPPTKEKEKTPPPTGSQRSAFESAYLDYVRSIFRTYSEFQQRAADTYQNYLRELNQTQSDLQKSGEDVRRNYVGSMQEAFGRDDAQARAEKAYRDYFTQIQESVETTQRRAEETTAKVNALLKTCVEDAQKGLAEARARYIQQFQNAAQQLDPANIRESDLAFISQSLGMVACYSACTQTLKR